MRTSACSTRWASPRPPSWASPRAARRRCRRPSATRTASARWCSSCRSPTSPARSPTPRRRCRTTRTRCCCACSARTSCSGPRCTWRAIRSSATCWPRRPSRWPPPASEERARVNDLADRILPVSQPRRRAARRHAAGQAPRPVRAGDHPRADARGQRARRWLRHLRGGAVHRQPHPWREVRRLRPRRPPAGGARRCGSGRHRQAAVGFEVGGVMVCGRPPPPTMTSPSRTRARILDKSLQRDSPP